MKSVMHRAAYLDIEVEGVQYYFCWACGSSRETVDGSNGVTYRHRGVIDRPTEFRHDGVTIVRITQ